MINNFDILSDLIDNDNKNQLFVIHIINKQTNKILKTYTVNDSASLLDKKRDIFSYCTKDDKAIFYPNPISLDKFNYTLVSFIQDNDYNLDIDLAINKTINLLLPRETKYIGKSLILLTKDQYNKCSSANNKYWIYTDKENDLALLMINNGNNQFLKPIKEIILYEP